MTSAADINGFLHNYFNLKSKGFSYYNGTLDETILRKMQNAVNSRVATGTEIKSQNDHFTLIDQPYTIDPFLDVALMDQILVAPISFFEGRNFYLGTCNLRRSAPSAQPETTTTLYHRDQNLGSLAQTQNNFLKVFIYLTDVGLENGPFTYCAGSHNRVLEEAQPYRVPDTTVATLYPNAEVRLTGGAGTIITANTTGLHKGTKIQQGYRDMFTINYSTIPEPGAANFCIKKEKFRTLSAQQRNMCRYLEKI